MDAKDEVKEIRLMTWWERVLWYISALAATSPGFEFGSAIVLRPSDETMERIEES